MLNIVFNIEPVTVPSHQGQIADLRVSHQEDHRALLYVATVRERQVAISYVGAKEPQASNIQMRKNQEFAGEVTVPENSWLYRYVLKTREGQRRFNLQTGNALITHRTKIDGSRIRPLWYRHEFDYELNEQEISSIEIQNENREAISNSNYDIYISNNEVHLVHDLEVGSDDSQQGYTVYFVEYTDSGGARRLELLKTTPLYRKARLEDGVQFTLYTYTVQYIVGWTAFEYEMHFRRDENGLPFDGPWYVKPIQDYQIEPIKPEIVRSNERWSIKIADGDVIGFEEENNVPVPRRYSIPEYHLQPFLPFEPRKYSPGVEAQVLSGSIVKLPFKKIIANEANVDFQVLITDNALNPKSGFTAKPSGDHWTSRLDQWAPAHSFSESPQLLNLRDSGGSVNSEEGLVHVPAELLSTDRVFAKCSYEEETYEFAPLNLNPLHNRNMLTGRAIVFVLSDFQLDRYPEDFTRLAVHYIIVDPLGQIVEWSHPSMNHAFHATAIADIYATPEEGKTAHDIFKEEFTGSLIIASIGITRTEGPDELTYIDVRHQGNLITKRAEEQIEELAQRYPELLWLSSNSLSERPIPLLSAMNVHIPDHLIEEFSGEYTRDMIEEKINRHSALGSLLVPEYYGANLKVISAEIDVTNNQDGNGVVDFTDAPIALTWQDNVLGASYKARLSTYNPRIDLNDLEEGRYTTVELNEGATLPSAGSPHGSGTIEIPSGIAIGLGEFLFLYIVRTKDGQEVARSNVIKIQLKTGATISYSDQVKLPIFGEIADPANVEISLVATIEE